MLENLINDYIWATNEAWSFKIKEAPLLALPRQVRTGMVELSKMFFANWLYDRQSDGLDPDDFLNKNRDLHQWIRNGVVYPLDPSSPPVEVTRFLSMQASEMIGNFLLASLPIKSWEGFYSSHPHLQKTIPRFIRALLFEAGRVDPGQAWKNYGWLTAFNQPLRIRASDCATTNRKATEKIAMQVKNYYEQKPCRENGDRFGDFMELLSALDTMTGWTVYSRIDFFPLEIRSRAASIAKLLLQRPTLNETFIWHKYFETKEAVLSPEIPEGLPRQILFNLDSALSVVEKDMIGNGLICFVTEDNYHGGVFYTLQNAKTIGENDTIGYGFPFQSASFMRAGVLSLLADVSCQHGHLLVVNLVYEPSNKSYTPEARVYRLLKNNGRVRAVRLGYREARTWYEERAPRVLWPVDGLLFPSY